LDTQAFRDGFTGKRVVVTGGGGFIGSHLADRLDALGANVCVYDSLADSGERYLAPGRDFVHGDIRDYERLSHAIATADFVFHHAAVASVPRCSEDPLSSLEINVQGTANVLEAVRQNGRCRLVFASSAAVYGSTAEPVLHREESPRRPTSVYGVSKSLGEDLIGSYVKSYGIEASIVRYANVYGPRQPRYILFDLYRKIGRADDTVELLGSGRQLRNFVYVADAVRATLAAALTSGTLTNVSTSRPSPIIDAARILANLMGKPDVRFVPTNASWLGDVEYLLCANDHMKHVAGGTETSLEDGIAEFLRWIASSSDSALPHVA
jgi:UDP-glucose 4-epimerase